MHVDGGECAAAGGQGWAGGGDRGVIGGGRVGDGAADLHVDARGALQQKDDLRVLLTPRPVQRRVAGLQPQRNLNWPRHVGSCPVATCYTQSVCGHIRPGCVTMCTRDMCMHMHMHAHAHVAHAHVAICNHVCILTASRMLVSAPASISASVTAGWPPIAAQCSAVTLSCLSCQGIGLYWLDVGY